MFCLVGERAEAMSRIGRMPIEIPPGVEVHFDEHNRVEVKGPKGVLRRTLHPRIRLRRHDNTIEVLRQGDAKLDKSLHGLSRTPVSYTHLRAHGGGGDAGICKAIGDCVAWFASAVAASDLDSASGALASHCL